MNIRSSLLAILIILFPGFCRSQGLNERILMTVGGKSIEAGEFIRMYNKSGEPGKLPPLDEYIGQFIAFKLKVRDAADEGYDTTRSFRDEINGYRNQLAQDYLTDNQVKDTLIKRAYRRSLTEINAWHILVALPPGPSASDTLKAWKKAADIRARILKGEPFERVARGASDDPSVKVNGGNLGYFTVFQMIMPFEDAAYTLRKGAISQPVRTPFGYHIIKVTDTRPSKGKIRVAHIMKNAPPGTGEKELIRAETDINLIYDKLKAGASFSDLAIKYSDHKESAAKGGELNWFGAGEMIPDFSEQAFSLTDTGTYTKPFRTIYGWHIVKLLEKKAPGSFEESSSYLESKINRSYLNSLSRRSFTEKLKKEYNFTINRAAYNWFIDNTDTLIIRGLKKYNRSGMPAGNIYTFADRFLTTGEFAGYLEKRGSMIVTNDSSIFINRSLDLRASDQLAEYENSVLEKKYPDFRYLMNEFHDGILLFEISGKKVWNRVSQDTAGLLKYYEDHKSNYLSRRSLEAKLYTLKTKNGQKSLASAYKRYSSYPDADRRLQEKFNTVSDTLLFIKDGTWYKGDDPEIDKLDWKPGAQSFTGNGFPSIIFIKKVTERLPLELEKVQEAMMTGYQEYLDSEWIGQLKEKYSVKIDKAVLGEVKKILKDE
jgi:peptidyl-prolyl cis-trans isomerase SurA